MEVTWPGWENVELLGEGSFGKVYRIRKEEFGTTYEAALKVISIPQTNSDIQAAYAEGMDEVSVTEYFKSCMEDIVAEFALMSQLKGNSNIVSYEDHMVVQHEDGIGWDILIRMELLTPLVRYIAQNTLSEQDVIRMGLHMARALELCRKRGILHRDIKPENIFLSKDGDFKLGDFGVARVAEKTISAMSRKGTYTYMAPEVYKGEEYGYTADIYSLGIVLYRFLNKNRTPFLPEYPKPIQYQDRERALNDRIMGKPMPLPADGSDELKRIVGKACAFRCADRYQSAAELERDLMKLQSGATAAGPQSFSAGWEEPTAQAAQGAANQAQDDLDRTMSAFGAAGPQESARAQQKSEEGAKARQTDGEGAKAQQATGGGAAQGSVGAQSAGSKAQEAGNRTEEDLDRTVSAFGAEKKTQASDAEDSDRRGKKSKKQSSGTPAGAESARGGAAWICGIAHGANLVLVGWGLCLIVTRILRGVVRQGYVPYGLAGWVPRETGTLIAGAALSTLAVILLANLIHKGGFSRRPVMADYICELILGVLAVILRTVCVSIVDSAVYYWDFVTFMVWAVFDVLIFVVLGLLLLLWSKTLRKKFV